MDAGITPTQKKDRVENEYFRFSQGSELSGDTFVVRFGRLL